MLYAWLSLFAITSLASVSLSRLFHSSFLTFMLCSIHVRVPFHSIAWCSARLICIMECVVCLFSFLFYVVAPILFSLFISLAFPSFFSTLFLYSAIINKFFHGFSHAQNSQRKLQYVVQWNHIKYATLFIAAAFSTTFHVKSLFKDGFFEWKWLEPFTCKAMRKWENSRFLLKAHLR